MALTFQVEAVCGNARAGRLVTPHGVLLTPAFMPVGTQAAVKALTPEQVWETGARLVLANAFHCMLRPGAELIERAGGLHAFMRWPGALLTDSGGFQVFSLAELRTVTPDGVWFKAPRDGSRHFMSPERSMAVQNALGADIAMVLDECVKLPASPEQIRAAVDRTTCWAERCLASHQNPAQALFGIVQGGTDPAERERSARALVALNFPGYAVGGLSVGESRTAMIETLQVTAPLLPFHKPRYLMGVGTPADLQAASAAGIDMFDCVHPTRMARHGTVWAEGERIHITNARFREDAQPLDVTCDCTTCARYDRRYLHHLARCGEYLSHTLLSIHNIRTLVRTAERLRREILAGTFQQLCYDRRQ
ncbi:MAG: tRNA guanosine(34) transglycosylase Tgt [Cyanobacteria bacterium NC_groundwater_1444_Ag_S-0.65um_54_12]|nr:tRNA guanosine(34) transglycosylase Tgt [Cyanobacteria bacterium NC_groundwater_1444_Ag_S-0.65um_54_12]